MKKRERTKEEWEKLLSQYEQRKCSRNEWCKANNVTVAQLKYWQSKLSNEESSEVEIPVSSNWLQLSSLNNETTTNKQVLILEVNGVSIKVDNDFDPNTLKQLIGVIKSC